MSEPASLDDVRARIDALDGELVSLLAARQSLVRRAAAFKADADAVRAPARAERVVAQARRRAVDAGLSADVAEAVWRAMVDAFIELELTEHRTSADPG